MDCRLTFNEELHTFFYDYRPVFVTESETSYIFKDKETCEIVSFLDYSFLIQLCNNGFNDLYVDIMRIALHSDGFMYVPTILLMPNKDRFVHDKIPNNLTSLKKLFSWLKIISLLAYNRLDLDNCDFRPYEKLQIAEIFQSINVSPEDPDEIKKCLEESQEIFDFKHNLKKISWFDLAIKKYKSSLPLLEDEKIEIDPRYVFLELNSIMRQICVWEASNYDLERVIASNIVFIYFLQDTNSSTNAYTALLPIMNALFVFNLSTTRPISNTSLEFQINDIFENARFNRERHSGLYTLHMKLKGLNKKCNRGDCVDLIQYIVAHCTFFKDKGADILNGYLRKCLNQFEKAEMYIYVIIFGSVLAPLRFLKRKQNTNHNLANLATFGVGDVNVKQYKISNYEKALRQYIKQDMNIIFDCVDSFVNFMISINPPELKLNDEILFCFMKSNDSISKFVTYLIETILPLITAQLV